MEGSFSFLPTNSLPEREGEKWKLYGGDCGIVKEEERQANRRQ